MNEGTAVCISGSEKVELEISHAKTGEKKNPKGLKVFLWVIFIIYLISGLIVSCSAIKNHEQLYGWLYYQNGPYRGRVIELDSGKPIDLLPKR